MGNSRPHHHLLRHCPLPDTDIVQHFGSTEPKEVSREINRLGQRDLQAKFRAVYGTQTYSNNNCWLRRKLMEAAGLQTPKASSRGRPTVKQGRAPSPGSGSQSEGPSMSRSGSMASQQASERVLLPECNVIRRTKRPPKPKHYEDMLISGQLPGHQASDDEEGRPAKIAATDSEMAMREELQAQIIDSGLVWSRSTSQSLIASHLITTPSHSWCRGLAPTTPEKPGFAPPVPAILAARQGSTASKLLGPQEVLGCCNLPAWADLPSNDRASSQDLDEISFQDEQESQETGDGSPSPASTSEVLTAPNTPERLMCNGRPSAAHLLHDPVMSSFLNRPSSLSKTPGTDFDYFAAASPSVTLPELLPTAPPEFERRIEFPMVSSAGPSDSAVSEMSALDVLLEEFSSNAMTKEFDAWLKDMPGPEMEPCPV